MTLDIQIISERWANLMIDEINPQGEEDYYLKYTEEIYKVRAKGASDCMEFI